MVNRIVWADSLKGWLMLLVILGHIIQSVLTASFDDNHLWNVIYSFHMPAFMSVSGWLAWRGDNDKAPMSLSAVVARRFRQLMIPYFLWSTLSFFKTGVYTFSQFSKMILYPDSYFWFLWVLFWISLLFTSAQRIAWKFNINEAYTLTFICLSLFCVMVGINWRMFGFQFISYYFIFYLLGYLVHKYNIRVESTLSLLIMAVVWFVLAWHWKMHCLPTWMPAIPHAPTTLLQYAYRGITAALAIFVLLCCAPKFINGNSLLNRKMQQFGSDSLGYYVAHLIWGSFIIEWFSKKFEDDAIIICLSFWVILFVSVFTILLIKKNRRASQILLGKI